MQELTSEEQFKNLLEVSEGSPVIIFKNSISCGVSFAVYTEFKTKLSEYEKHTQEVYELTVQNSPELKMHIASILNIKHESPQLIILKDGKSVYDASHYDIKPELILEKLSEM